MVAEDFGDRSAERATAERFWPQLLAILGGLPVRDREEMAARACARLVAHLSDAGTSTGPVQRNPDGTVTVRISQFAFDSRLAQTLRSDGVPALIRARVVHDPRTGPLTSPMPAGSVLYVSTATLYGSGKYPSGAFTVWVLRQDRQPACTS